MSWYVTLGAWFTGAAGLAVIGLLIVMAIASNFFSRAVSTVAWLIAVGALALITVSKDVVIAKAESDMATHKLNVETERTAAAERLARIEREARAQVDAAAARAARQKAAQDKKMEILQHELEQTLRAHPEMGDRRIPDDVVRVLNQAARDPLGTVGDPGASGAAGAGLPGAAAAGAGGKRSGSLSLGARLRSGLGLRAPEQARPD